VWTVAAIVRGQPRSHVGSQSRVVAPRFVPASENVDEAPIESHAHCSRKRSAMRNIQKIVARDRWLGGNDNCVCVSLAAGGHFRAMRFSGLLRVEESSQRFLGLANRSSR
jgi:hypothetical protein